MHRLFIESLSVNHIANFGYTICILFTVYRLWASPVSQGDQVPNGELGVISACAVWHPLYLVNVPQARGDAWSNLKYSEHGADIEVRIPTACWATTSLSNNQIRKVKIK